MTIQIGNRLPEGFLFEFVKAESQDCSFSPNILRISTLIKEKKIIIFAMPGAFTPTCSTKHLPGYITYAAAFKAKGVNEILALSVNDAFVMEAWGQYTKATGIVRMLADGNAMFTKTLGLDIDLSEQGMGIRSQRYSMLLEDGIIMKLNVEKQGKFEVSNAETLMMQLS